MSTTEEVQSAQLKMRQLNGAVLVGEMYCQGKTYAQISSQLRISMGSVASAMKLARRIWQERASEAYEHKLAEELAKIDRLEQESWKGWYDSRKAAIKIMDRTRSGGEEGTVKEKSRSKENQYGDPRFLDLIGKQIDRRIALLGLQPKESTQDVATQLLEVIISTRDEAKKMLPYLDFANSVQDAGTVDAENIQEGANNEPIESDETRD